MKVRFSHRKLHLLFVCGRNKWRSPTAERMYRFDERLEVRSAGVSSRSSHKISGKDIEWADLILVMEAGYKAWIKENFNEHALPRIEDLDIPDDYQFMDEDLVEAIRKGVESYILSMQENDAAG